MILFLVAYLTLLILGDASFTRGRIEREGLKVEGNVILKLLITKLGPSTGVGLGLIVPNLLFLILLVAINWIGALYFWAGMRTLLAINQLESSPGVRR